MAAQTGVSSSAHSPAALVAGFTVVNVFSGLVHAFFWDSVLPPGAVGGLRGTDMLWLLVFLTLMSWAWMWLYAIHGSVLGVCWLHAAVDYGLADSIALRPPWG